MTRGQKRLTSGRAKKRDPSPKTGRHTIDIVFTEQNPKNYRVYKLHNIDTISDTKKLYVKYM